MSTELLEHPDTRTTIGGDDPDEVAHIIYSSNGQAAARVTEAVVLGAEVVALCGYRWIPHRDHAALPLCEVCKALKAAVQGGVS